MQTEPTERDIDTLARALHLEERFQAGIFPITGGDHSHFAKLCRFDMLEFTGEMGFDIDGEIDREVPIYKLTDAGRAWIKAREDEAQRRCDEAVARDLSAAP